ncbi:thiol reductant ABC exporter subunit CydD [Actinomyces sp. MRS3W]|uniref:thiol reductant ABC exporter subunit CydD n=1 Tax=Actinomyces sp. MRS3W TaxID=2800796 RepID=UPI002905F37B|nr:thiol reductant ABC exporter subunit CydD [Actinomyces sp. MRS3W]
MRYARAARRYIVTTAATGTATALLVVAQAYLISHAIAPVITGEAAAQAVRGTVLLLAGVIAARALVLYAQESRAHRAAVDVTIDLRRQVLQRAAALGPRWRALHGADTATLLTRGLDDLEPYFTRYLPQLLLAATVTPATGLVLLTQDLPSAVAVACTIPLIPVFMILIGRLTQKHSEQRLRTMEQLGSQLLDLLAGLPTLKALGREAGPARRVRELGRAYNATTMSTLRVAFLSGAVLEFITTLSVAIIAVEVGFRLLYGRMDLATGLLVIMITPEVYQPLRQVGFQFHASTNGVAAAEAVFAILEAPTPPQGTLPAPDLRTCNIELDDVSVAARGSWAPAGLSAVIRPGRVVALTGPSGTGKTTTSQLLLTLLRPDRGRIRVVADDGRTVDLADIDPVSWWEQVIWVPQRPVILPGTLLDNLVEAQPPARPASAQPPASPADSTAPVPHAVARAAAATGFDHVVAALPDGWHTRVGQGGVGLSVGQRQRLALTRALAATAPLVLLDEPTAHLDAASQAQVLDAVTALREAGRTVVVIAHREALVALADDVVTVVSPPAAAAGGER